MVAPARPQEAVDNDEPMSTKDALYPASVSLSNLARILFAQHSQRRKYMPGATFEDPQWLMMLDLYIASEEGRDISVSSLCFASGVPSTTALRHIRALVANDVFERVSHPRDKRICHVRLSETARSQMIGYLLSVASGSLELDERPALHAAH
jgi:DNA-binding MarR family transcriptional regulator